MVKETEENQNIKIVCHLCLTKKKNDINDLTPVEFPYSTIFQHTETPKKKKTLNNNKQMKSILI